MGTTGFAPSVISTRTRPSPSGWRPCVANFASYWTSAPLFVIRRCPGVNGRRDVVPDFGSGLLCDWGAAEYRSPGNKRRAASFSSGISMVCGCEQDQEACSAAAYTTSRAAPLRFRLGAAIRLRRKDRGRAPAPAPDQEEG